MKQTPNHTYRSWQIIGHGYLLNEAADKHGSARKWVMKCMPQWRTALDEEEEKKNKKQEEAKAASLGSGDESGAGIGGQVRWCEGGMGTVA